MSSSALKYVEILDMSKLSLRLPIGAEKWQDITCCKHCGANHYYRI